MKQGLYYKAVYGFLRWIYPCAKTLYEEVPEEAGVFVCNHAAIRGPVMMTLDFPRPHKTWAVSLSMNKEAAKSYAFHDVFFGESRKHKWFYRFLSRIVAIALPPLVRGAQTIPVYHDTRILNTFKQSVKTLEAGEDLVIFAEKPERYSQFVCRINDGFISLAAMYYRRTKKILKFYPVYVEKKSGQICVGKPVAYDPEEPMDAQKERIGCYLTENIHRLGRSLPPHKPVPFVPQRWYDAYGQYENDVPGYWKMIQNDR